MVTQCDEQVKEELAASVMHLELHGPAALECASASDDESEIMGSKLGVGIRRIGVSVACRREDCAALNS